MPYSHWLCIPESLFPTPTPTRLVSYTHTHKSVHPELHSTIIAGLPAANAQAQEAEATRSCPKLRSTRDRPTAGRPVLEDAQARRTHRMGGNDALLLPSLIRTDVGRAHSILILILSVRARTPSPPLGILPLVTRRTHCDHHLDPLTSAWTCISYAHTYALHRRTLPQCMYNNQSITKIPFSVLLCLCIASPPSVLS